MNQSHWAGGGATFTGPLELASFRVWCVCVCACVRVCARVCVCASLWYESEPLGGGGGLREPLVRPSFPVYVCGHCSSTHTWVILMVEHLNHCPHQIKQSFLGGELFRVIV